MKFARGFLIFCYGLFTIGAQTLLFREFVTTFESSDISVGVFFASWFFWIGVGALFVRGRQKSAGGLNCVDLIFLAYIPAFVLELILILHARQIAGLGSYDLWPIDRMVILSLVVNAPVSLITGIFFPLACRWVREDSRCAISRVYVIEAAGGFAGGILATILPGMGVCSTTLFWGFAISILLAVGFVRLAQKKYAAAAAGALAMVCVLAGLAAGFDKRLDGWIQSVKWTRLLSAEALAGSFQTAQAQYLYGTYQSQWVVVREGSTCEAFPDKAATGRIAASVLAQKPDAKRILVIGSGLGLCYEFLRLADIERVTWSHYDNQYVQKVEQFLPPQLKVSDLRLVCQRGDIRRLSEPQNPAYDIIVINLHDATSSVLNRYFTDEFYRQLKKMMTADGIVAVRVTGGENVMGAELVALGASAKHTLGSVFSRLVIIPGDDTWFIASDSDTLTGDPGVLQKRFAGINNAESVFVPAGLLSVYQPDRAAAALKAYAGCDLPEGLLTNSDARPLASLYSLLLASRQSGAPVTRIVKLLAAGGVLVMAVPIIVYMMMRFVLILRSKKQTGVSSFDGSMLVFTAGWLGIGSVIVLMYLYQTQFGSLYLHVGMISSLFMAGLTAGAFFIGYVLRKDSRSICVLGVIALHIGLLAAMTFLSVIWNHYYFAAAFLLCGLCTGAYFPIAAKQLADGGFETVTAGAKLETADHIGAAAGSLLTGLVLIPILGTRGVMLLLMVLIVCNIGAALLRLFGKTSDAVQGVWDFRRTGYVLAWGSISGLICTGLLLYKAADQYINLPKDTARILAGPLLVKPASVSNIRYYEVYDSAGKLAGYVFSTLDLAPQVSGYGGKINVGVFIDTTGKLLNFSIIQSNETPEYLDMLTEWNHKLIGRPLFTERTFADIQAVTGATETSAAILSAIRLSADRFSMKVPGGLEYGRSPDKPALPPEQPSGQSQETDDKQIRKLIEEKKLSDHEALFYKKVD